METSGLCCLFPPLLFISAFVGVVANKLDPNPEVHLYTRHIGVVGDNTNKGVSELVKRILFATVQRIDRC